MNREPNWSLEEFEILLKNPKLNDDELSSKLTGRSSGAIGVVRSFIHSYHKGGDTSGLSKLMIEELIRYQFNSQMHYNAIKKRDVEFGGDSKHEFDIFEEDKVIGGISTTPWKNKTGSSNSGGQDRVATELLWLSLWPGQERRVVILTKKDMAQRLLKRWGGCSFPHRIEVLHYDALLNEFQPMGVLSKH